MPIAPRLEGSKLRGKTIEGRGRLSPKKGEERDTERDVVLHVVDHWANAMVEIKYILHICRARLIRCASGRWWKRGVQRGHDSRLSASENNRTVKEEKFHSERHTRMPGRKGKKRVGIHWGRRMMSGTRQGMGGYRTSKAEYRKGLVARKDKEELVSNVGRNECAKDRWGKRGRNVAGGGRVQEPRVRRPRTRRRTGGKKGSGATSETKG